MRLDHLLSKEEEVEWLDVFYCLATKERVRRFWMPDEGWDACMPDGIRETEGAYEGLALPR